jgi:ABC-type arginine transport system ATPase subunit/tetratricopeptide (TPR) repeat protein
MRRRRPVLVATGDDDLERFFTDCEQARARFDELIAAPDLPCRLLVVHGPGAVGKTSLLRMFRLAAHRRGTPVALVASEEAPSAVELLDRWARDLRADGAAVEGFEARLRHYRQLQSKVEAEARNAGQAQADAAEKLAVAVGKGAVKMAASSVPAAGPVLEAVGGEAVEAVINLIRAVLSRDDLEFFLDPTGHLTESFLADVTDLAPRRRVVLMLDTLETVTAAQDWLRDLARNLPEGVLLVLAGRSLPPWDKDWPGWLARAELMRLTEMSDVDIEHLVRQYYALFRLGEPDADQVADVVRFARGLPLAATTAVRLWAEYHVAELRPTSPGTVADMADRLLEGVPATLRPAFEAAALLRYFDADSLAALLPGTADVNALYDELRRWPFTRARSGGFAVHDTMREVMGDALRARSPEQFRALSEAAARYYATLASRAQGEERQRLRLEELYHLVRADELAGITEFRTEGQRLVGYQLLARLRALINDANSWPLRQEGAQLWRAYYAARLNQLSGLVAAAEPVYLATAERHDAEPLLQAYAWCDLGAIYATLDRLAEPNGESRAQRAVQRSLQAHPALDDKLAANHITLMNIANSRAAWSESMKHIGALRRYAETANDPYRHVEADLLLSTVQGLEGDWPGYLATRARCLDQLRALGDVPVLRMQVAYFVWPLVFSGHLAEAQDSSEEAYRLAIRLDERELLITIVESIGLALGMQDRFDEADARFTEAMNYYENFHLGGVGSAAPHVDRYIRATLSFRGLIALRAGRLDDAECDLLRALDIKRAIGDRIGLPEIHVSLGQLHERRGNRQAAEESYLAALDLRELNRHYYEALASIGLARVRAAGHRAGECAERLRQAEELAERYGYRDVAAAVALLRGHLAWEAGPVGAVTTYYRTALEQALLQSRYLLDEVLAGRLTGTDAPSVVDACAARGADGRSVLEGLRDWWRKGQIFDAAEGEVRSLVGVEDGARSTEPGAGDMQIRLIDRIDVALGGG